MHNMKFIAIKKGAFNPFGTLSLYVVWTKYSQPEHLAYLSYGDLIVTPINNLLYNTISVKKKKKKNMEGIEAKRQLSGTSKMTSSFESLLCFIKRHFERFYHK